MNCPNGGHTLGSSTSCHICVHYQRVMVMQNAGLGTVAVGLRGGGFVSTSAAFPPIAFGQMAQQILAQQQSPATPPKALESGFKTEDLIGWRIWRVQCGYLRSYSADQLWLPDEPMTGVPGDHDAAGVWAFKRKSAALNKMTQNGSGFACGSVRLWGDVIEHSDGFRAANARVLTIDDMNPRDWALLADLRERYGVPGVEQAQQKAATHPAPPPAVQPTGFAILQSEDQPDWGAHLRRWATICAVAAAANGLSATYNIVQILIR